MSISKEKKSLKHVTGFDNIHSCHLKFVPSMFAEIVYMFLIVTFFIHIFFLHNSKSNCTNCKKSLNKFKWVTHYRTIMMPFVFFKIIKKAIFFKLFLLANFIDHHRHHS